MAGASGRVAAAGSQQSAESLDGDALTLTAFLRQFDGPVGALVNCVCENTLALRGDVRYSLSDKRLQDKENACE